MKYIYEKFSFTWELRPRDSRDSCEHNSTGTKQQVKTNMIHEMSRYVKARLKVTVLNARGAWLNDGLMAKVLLDRYQRKRNVGVYLFHFVYFSDSVILILFLFLKKIWWKNSFHINKLLFYLFKRSKCDFVKDLEVKIVHNYFMLDSFPSNLISLTEMQPSNLLENIELTE